MKYTTQACFFKMTVSCVLENWKMNQNKGLKWRNYESIRKEIVLQEREREREEERERKEN